VTFKDIAIHLLNEQYKLVGLTFEQVKTMPWDDFLAYKITLQQQTEWKEWAVTYLRKKKRWTKKLAQKEVAMLDFQYGISLDI
jgi:hypothetical protein